MTEEGYRAFLAEPGLEDWVVLHGGAVAAFRTASLADAARLATAIADIPAVAASSSILTLTGARLTVRLTRDLWELEAATAELAREVSAVVRSHGATPDRASVQEVQLAIAGKAADLDLGFWRAVLGYASRVAPDNAVDPLGHGATVWLQELDDAKPLRHAMHVDVSVPAAQGRARLEAALAAGGRIVALSDEHWTLSDRAGNRVCIAVWPDGGTTGAAEDRA